MKQPEWTSIRRGIVWSDWEPTENGFVSFGKARVCCGDIFTEFPLSAVVFQRDPKFESIARHHATQCLRHELENESVRHLKRIPE